MRKASTQLPIDTEKQPTNNNNHKKKKFRFNNNTNSNSISNKPLEGQETDSPHPLLAPPVIPKTPTAFTSSEGQYRLKMLASQFKPRSGPGKSQAEMDVPSWLPADPLNPQLFSQDNADALAAEYGNAKPYRHVQIHNLCTKEAMCEIQNEIINRLPTTARETDLFKVNQSLDLNNVDMESDLAQTIPYLMALRTYIYAKKFRSFLQKVTNCADIIDTVDCAANVYSGSHGNHLLTHDDVITTRVLSYIIYLPFIDQNEAIYGPENKTNGQNNEKNGKNGKNENIDEEGNLIPQFDQTNSTPWDHTMGGHLELYDKLSANVLPFGVYPSAQDQIRGEHHDHDVHEMKKFDPSVSQFLDENPKADLSKLKFSLPPKNINIPFAIPSKCVSPQFNSIIVFEVKPQASYHSVQEVYSINSKRISIQGWFHQNTRQPDYGATLRMLQIKTLEPTIAIIPPSVYGVKTPVEGGDMEDSKNDEKNDDDIATAVKRDALQLVVDNNTAALTTEEATILAHDMFPSRQFQLFQNINDDALQATFQKLSQVQGKDDDNTDDNLDQLEIDYLSKIILIHLNNINTKQGLTDIINKENDNDVDKSITKSGNNESSSIPTSFSTPTTPGAEEPSSNEEEEIDLYTPALVKHDLQFLRKFIAPEYSSVSVLKQLQTQWEEQPVIQLGGFLKPELIQLVIKSLVRTDVVDRIALIPDFSRYIECDDDEDAEEDAEDEDDMDFDFGADEDVEEDVEDEDDMDFDFGLSDEDDEEKPKKPTKSSKSTNTTATRSNNTEINTQSESTLELMGELLEETPLVTRYNPKNKPPSYTIGIDPVSHITDSSDPMRGSKWKLSGPAYLQRYSYFSTQFMKSTNKNTNNGQNGQNGQNNDLVTSSHWSKLLTQFNSLPIRIKSGLILEALVKFLFGSIAFTRIIEWITSYRLLAYRSTIRRFRTGLDYSVGNYNDMIECSTHDVLAAAVESANEAFIEQSSDPTDVENALHLAVANSVDITTILPNTLAMLDIILSFCDNGQFDHMYGQHIWQPEVKSNGEDLNQNMTGNDDKNDDENGDENDVKNEMKTIPQIVTQNPEVDTILPTILLESHLYPNSNKDIIMSDLNTRLEDIDYNGVVQAQQVIANVSGAAFSTLPPCDVRFKQKQHRWESDDCGAFMAYIPVDQTTEGDDAQQYVENNEQDDLISLSLSNNTLTICKRRPNVLNFVRYVNYHAPGSRYDISMNCIYQEDQ